MHHARNKQQRAAGLDDLGRVIITKDRAVEVVPPGRYREIAHLVAAVELKIREDHPEYVHAHRKYICRLCALTTRSGLQFPGGGLADVANWRHFCVVCLVVVAESFSLEWCLCKFSAKMKDRTTEFSLCEVAGSRQWSGVIDANSRHSSAASLHAFGNNATLICTGSTPCVVSLVLLDMISRRMGMQFDMLP